MANVTSKSKQYKNKKTKKQAKMKQNALMKQKERTPVLKENKINTSYHAYSEQELERRNSSANNTTGTAELYPDETNGKDYYRHASILLWLSSLALGVGLGLWNQFEYKKILYGLILIVILDGVLLTYIQLQEKGIFTRKYAWIVMSLGYAITFVCLCNPYHLEDYLFWIAGTMLIAYYVNLNVSLLTMFGLLAISGVLGQASLKNVLFQVLLGSILCCMMRFLKKWIHLAYMILLAISLEITLLFIRNSFEITQIMQRESVETLCYLIAMIVALFIVIRLFPSTQEIHPVMITNVKESVCEETAATKEQSPMEPKEEEPKEDDLEDVDKERLITIARPDFALLQKLKEESLRLYEHSRQVADFSERAAKEIHVNADLAKAGAWYHEIGRLLGKDYINNGIELAKEYGLPEAVIAIIRQHNFKVELPQSPEAAIVMLTDNILSTIQYLKANNDTQITTDKIIENTFLVRLNKGTLNESGLTLDQFNGLKNYYMSIIDEFRKEEK